MCRLCGRQKLLPLATSLPGPASADHDVSRALLPPPRLFRCQIPYKMMDSNDPRRKKARDRQRSIDRIRKKKSGWVLS